ncbi:AAA family ATPase [Nocardioides sp. WS12]|uniref:AAA family ATPase n=1 Tax=Nocardioides sp. WS12 TaxID=2486272 RepID=UPI0015FC5B4E|nr:AAA family ATPase [Nocardioides sp. WS12]
MTERRSATHPTSLSGLKDLVAHQDFLQNDRPRVDDSDRMRRRYNGRISFLEHRANRAFLDTGQEWMEINEGRMPARWLGLEGAFHTGKSETAAMLALKVCRDVWGEFGHEVEDAEGRHVIYPVVYVVAGANDTERQLCEQMMFALDMPEPARRDTTTTTAVLNLIAAQMRRSRTELLCIDDTHQIQVGRGRHVTKFFKKTFSTLPVTLLFIADQLDETWLLKPSGSDPENQKAAQQLAERKIVTTYVPVPVSAAGQSEWIELVQLCLDAPVLQHDHTLTGVDYAWLLQMCQGHRVKLLETMILASRRAVGGSERIDRPGLEEAARVLEGDS